MNGEEGGLPFLSGTFGRGLMRRICEEEIIVWLDDYRQAWECRDPERVAALFTPDALYQENPFAPPLRGRVEVASYWATGARDSQRDVRFSSTLWHLAADVAVAHWAARFTRYPGGSDVSLDGVFRLEFNAPPDGLLLCRSLREWWLRKES